MPVSDVNEFLLLTRAPHKRPRAIYRRFFIYPQKRDGYPHLGPVIHRRVHNLSTTCPQATRPAARRLRLRPRAAITACCRLPRKLARPDVVPSRHGVHDPESFVHLGHILICFLSVLWCFVRRKCALSHDRVSAFETSMGLESAGGGCADRARRERHSRRGPERNMAAQAVSR